MKQWAVLGLMFLACGLATAGGLTADEAAALDRLEGADVQVRLSFERTELSKIFDSLGKAAPFEVTFADDAGSEYATVEFEKQSLKQVLVGLAAKYELAYEVVDDRHLVVRRRSTGKRVG